MPSDHPQGLHSWPIFSVFCSQTHAAPLESRWAYEEGPVGLQLWAWARSHRPRGHFWAKQGNWAQICILPPAGQGKLGSTLRGHQSHPCCYCKRQHTPKLVHPAAQTTLPWKGNRTRAGDLSRWQLLGSASFTKRTGVEKGAGVEQTAWRLFFLDF